MADYIPSEIQVEIMKRLPAMSLVRFRSVSKQWKSLIDSPTFITDHCVFQHHTQSQHHLLLSYVKSGCSMSRYLSIVDDDTFPQQKVLMTTPLSVKTKTLVGVSRGLFCFYGSFRGDVHNAVFWNPSIKKTVTISMPNVPDDVPFRTMLGFYVCPRTSDPKLVQITYISRYHKEYPTIPNQVEVFSLSSGLWKPLPTGKMPLKPIVSMNPQVTINDSIYWLAYDYSDLKGEYSRFIISFDFTTEEFTEVYLPPTLASFNTHVSISKVNQSLVVLEKDDHSNANVNVWIMQNRDPISFTPIFTIHTRITSISHVAGFRKNGAPLLSVTKSLKERELIVFEPNSKKITYTGIAGPFIDMLAMPYTPTLLLLDYKHCVDPETPIRKRKQGTRSGRLRRLGKGATSSSSAASSSTSYYGASKRDSLEEVNEHAKKKSKIIGKRKI